MVQLTEAQFSAIVIMAETGIDYAEKIAMHDAPEYAERIGQRVRLAREGLSIMADFNLG